jgi:hypothetical protein
MTNATLETPELARVLANALAFLPAALRPSLRLSTSAPIAFTRRGPTRLVSRRPPGTCGYLGEADALAVCQDRVAAVAAAGGPLPAWCGRRAAPTDASQLGKS